MKNEERSHWAVVLSIVVSVLICFTFTSQPVCAVAKTHFSYSHVDLVVGGSYKPKLITSSGKIIKSSDISWKSGKKSVVKVSPSGKVTGKKTGKAKIYATYKNKTYSFSVQVYKFNARKVRKQLNIPNNMKTKVVKTGEYYWESVGIWLVSVEVYWRGECIAFADVDVKSLKLARQISTYNPVVDRK